MKKIISYTISLFTIFIFFMLQNPVSAAENKITNSNGIKITEEQYENLKDLGFTDLAIDQMDKEIFDENKDLVLESKTETTKYYEISEGVPGPQLFSLETSEENPNYISTELSEEEYFKRVEAAKSSIKPFSTGSAQTSYRRLTTSIQRISGDIRVHNKFVWDIIPVTRSYDTLSISIDSTFSPLAGTQHGQQLWTTTHPMQGGLYGGNATYTSASNAWNKQGAGYGVKMNLKDNTSTSRVVDLEGYMYYKIAKNSSVVPVYINAYGNYSHAKTTVSSSYSYSLSYGGPAISWAGVTSTSFDTITTHAQTKY
ncbi:hypothetical protein [Sporosarcina sp. Marseille-Q4943]|uniref:hypothetical protein n=1 Tax=Sporosarcina sp. Marseille-Q4943 TaxID=2942204 RepID=UPI00208DAE67|nr:hypothetical protein [Sporosarcina sp. Marseille-Q4943]